MYELTCAKQKAPDNSEGDRSLQNCWSLVWNQLYVTMLATRICRQLLDFRQNGVCVCVCVCAPPWSRCSHNPPHTPRQYRTIFPLFAYQRSLHICTFGHVMEVESRYFSDVDILNAVHTDELIGILTGMISSFTSCGCKSAQPSPAA